MKKHLLLAILCVLAVPFIFMASNSSARSSMGGAVDDYCLDSNPYVGDCLLCHTDGKKSDWTQEKDEYLAGNLCYFCPTDTACGGGGDTTPPTFGGVTGATDAGTGGTVSLTWSAATDPSTPISYNIYWATTPGGQNFTTPDATSSSGTGVTVSGLTDDMIYYFVVRAEDSVGNEDTNTVEVSATPTGGGGPVDADDDGYDETVDCNEGDPNINPGAEEDCTDLIDNDCDNLIDAQDPDAVGCPVTCTDGDGDTYNVETQNCGAVDCDDSDASINPGAVEDCTDFIDNDCDNKDDCADSDCVGDPACQSSGTCSDYNDKASCNADTSCSWGGGKVKSCRDADGGGEPPSSCSDYDGTDKATCEVILPRKSGHLI